MFYIKGALIFLLGLLGIFGSIGSAEFGIISIPQMLLQIAITAALMVLIAHAEVVIKIVYRLLLGLYRALQAVSQHVRQVRNKTCTARRRACRKAKTT